MSISYQGKPKPQLPNKIAQCIGCSKEVSIKDPMTNNTPVSNAARINAQIRATQVRLISSSGENLGVMDTWQALKLAKDEGLDLIELNPKSTPIVCTIGDSGKLRYEQAKKEKEARKNQKANETREIAFRPTTDEHDLAHKIAKVKEFLSAGSRVRLVVKFRGREVSHADLGKERLDQVLAEIADLTASYTPYNLKGKSIITVVSPKQ
jgi:translation initiation factor IF-3